MNEFRPGRFEILPLVIKNLLIINGLVYLAQITLPQVMGNRLTDMFALHYWGSDLFRPHQILTHMFMHDTSSRFPWHLVMNMFTLWMFGSTLENVWGPKRFLIFYIICGIGAALCHLGVLTYDNVNLTRDAEAFLRDPSYSNFALLDRKYDLSFKNFSVEGLKNALAQNPDNPQLIQDARVYVQAYVADYRDNATIGASGAVYGILFAFGYLFPNSLIFLYFLFPLKAKYFVGILIVLELISGIQNSAGDNVAHFAHLGGVLFGFILLKIWNKKNRRHFY
jgi:membrane associated rhomboid family serine protease